MSQTPIALPTTLTHKPFAWRHWLMPLIVATLLSGGYWWAKETGRLDSLLTSSTTATATINSGISGAAVSTTQQTTAPVAVNSTESQSPTVANTTIANPTERTTQPDDIATTATETTDATKVDEVASAPRSLVAVAGIDGVQVWNAAEQLLTTLDIGAKLQATARTADGQWLTIEADQASGWAQATQVVAFDLTDLPVTTLAAPVKTASSQAVVTAEATRTAVETTPSTVATEAQAPVATTPQETTVQPVSSIVTAVVTTNGANLNARSGPSTNEAVVTKIANGATVTVLGRTESSDWLQIQLSTTTADTGWVATQYLQVERELDALPVMTTVTD